MTRLLTASARRALLGGLLGASLATWGAAPAPAQAPKEEPKKAEPKKVERDDPFLPPGLDPAEARRIQEQLRAVQEAMRRQLEEMRRIDPDLFKDLPQRVLPGAGFPALERRPRANRLGAVVQSPTPVLVDQLDLPKDQGVVVQEVRDESAAGKAGLRPNDIVLELDGKAVPSQPEEFARMLDGIKPDAVVDATVLRKGKKETIKGIKLPEVKAEEPLRLPPLPQLPVPNIQIQPILPTLPPGTLPPVVLPGAETAAVQMTRTKDSFTTRSRKNKDRISITGKMKDGKAEVEEVVITANAETRKYKNVDDVPPDMRDQVRDLIKLTEMGAGTTEPEKKR